MSEALSLRELVPLEHSGERVVAIACTPDGSVVFVRTAKFMIREDELCEVLAFLASARARLLEANELRVHGQRVLGIYARVDEHLAAACHLPSLRSLQLGAPGEDTASLRTGDERGA